jgi:hypothetical protein
MNNFLINFCLNVTFIKSDEIVQKKTANLN